METEEEERERGENNFEGIIFSFGICMKKISVDPDNFVMVP